MPDDLSPEDVVRAAIAAMEEERWADLIPLVDPAALAPFADSFVASLRAMAERTPRTAEEIRAAEPWLPLAVAEHQAAEERTWIERGRPQLLREWGVRDFAELEPLSPEELFVRYAAANSPLARLRQAWAVSHTPVEDPEAEAAKHPPMDPRRVVVGSVVEDDRYAHVLFREHYGDDTSSVTPDARLTTLLRTRAGWRLRMDGSLLMHQGWMRVYRAEDEPADEPG